MRTRTGTLLSGMLGYLVLATLLPGTPAIGQAGSSHPQAITDCSNCHLNPGSGEADIQLVHGFDCGLCHTGAGFSSTFLGPTGTWQGECGECHAPHIAETAFLEEPTKGHRCVACHGVQMDTSNITNIHKKHAERANCVVCHGFIPDVGTEIGSGSKAICQTCHTGTPEFDLEKVHEKHVPEGVSCLECHGGVRPPVDVDQRPTGRRDDHRLPDLPRRRHPRRRSSTSRRSTRSTSRSPWTAARAT